ncbi:MAG: 1,4-alpha-glucan branching protein GlgB [Betaproteobacteria bacterium]
MTEALQKALQPWLPDIEALSRGEGAAVGRLLGAHSLRRQALILTYLGDGATDVSLEGRRRMVRCGDSPVYAWLGERSSLPSQYRIDWTDRFGVRQQRTDPYQFGPGLTDADVTCIAGDDPPSADLLGADPLQRRGVAGTRFAVWAPRAQGVFLTLPGGSLAMYPHPEAGVWSLFLPDTRPGTPYGFELTLADGRQVWHTDPCGRAFEPRPGWRARIPEYTQFPFEDADWLARRCRRHSADALSIYEVHLGSFLRRPAESATYAALAERLVRHVGPMGFTHVELLPITEHPFEGSWGYQTTGYHAPTNRHGSADDFRGFVDRLHRAGLGVILDWVPGHFACDEAALAAFDGAPLYEESHPRMGRHEGWGTLVVDFKNPQVRAFLLSSARRFLRDFHIDGLRIDAVAAMLYLDYDRREGEWVANAHGGAEHLEGIAFLRQLTETLHREFPGVLLIAEDSSLYPGVTEPVDRGGLGFDYKWNLGWMHDSLRYFREDPLFRRHHHAVLPRIGRHSRRDRGVLALSHDEVVHGKRSLFGKMPGDDWQRFANLRLLLAWQWTHPGAKLLFMGAEMASPQEWDHQTCLPWECRDDPSVRGLEKLISDLNHLYRESAALQGDDLQGDNLRFLSERDDLRSIYVYERRTTTERLVIILNATPVPRERHVIGLPVAGTWTEILNTDSTFYGGTDVGNLGGVTASADPAMGEPYSATVRLPPLGALVLTPADSGKSNTATTAR